MTAVREASTEQDYLVARGLIEEYATSLGFDLGFQDFRGELASFPGSYAPPGGCVLLGEVGGNVCGCVALRPLAQGVCEMKRLYVRPACRGRGVGRALAEAVISQARRRGYSTMRLDTLSSMAEANALYQSLGFREAAPYRYNPIEGARFFALDLKPDAESLA